MDIGRGVYEKATKYFLQALKISEQIGHSEGVATSYVYLAQVYYHLQDLAQALSYQRRALKIYEETGNRVRQAVLLMEIGSNYLTQDQPWRALDYYQRAVSVERHVGHPPNPTLLSNLGAAYEALDRYDQALDHYRQSLDRLPEESQLMPSFLHKLAFLFYEQGQYDSARYYGQASVRRAESIQQRAWLKDGLFLLSKVYEAQQDYARALSTYQRATAYQDSIWSEEKTRQVAELQTRYEVNRKEQQIAAQNQRIALLAQNQRVALRLRIVLSAALCLLGLLLVFLHRRYRFKRQAVRLLGQKNREIQTKNEQIARMNRELEKRMLRAQMDPHFIFNSLNAIQHLMASDNKKSALIYLAKFSKLVRTVLENSVSAHVPVADEIALLERYLELESLRFQSQFTYRIAVDEAVDVYGTEIPFLLVQPYVENALVHGLRRRSAGGQLAVTFSSVEGGIHCRIEDNGIGRAAAQQHGRPGGFPSRGMSVTQQRLEALDQAALARVQISDLYDTQHRVRGTRVDIFIPQSDTICLTPSL